MSHNDGHAGTERPACLSRVVQAGTTPLTHNIALTTAAEFAGREQFAGPDAPSTVNKSCTRKNRKRSSRLARVHALLLEQEGHVAGLLVTSQTYADLKTFLNVCGSIQVKNETTSVLVSSRRR